MRWSPRTKRSGWRAWRRREADRPRARRCRAPARATAATRARLDAELLMAEALHIDRDKLILSPPDRQVPDRFWQMVERRKAGEPVAYITGRRAFWNIELHVGPGVLVPRPDSRSADRLGDRAFRGHAGPEADPRPRHRTRNLLLAALDVWPEATGLGIDVSRQRVVLRRGQCPAARVRSARSSSSSAIGPKALTETLRPHPVQPALCCRGRGARPGRARVRAGRGAVRRREGPRRLSRARARSCRGCSNKGGLAAVEIGQDQAAGGHRLAGARRLAGAGRARPRRTATARAAVNLGLNENRLASAVGRTTSVVRAGPAPDNCRAHPVPTPDAIGRSLRALMRRPEREGQEPAPDCAALLRLRPKGLATTA